MSGMGRRSAALLLDPGAEPLGKQGEDKRLPARRMDVRRPVGHPGHATYGGRSHVVVCIALLENVLPVLRKWWSTYSSDTIYQSLPWHRVVLVYFPLQFL